MVLRKEYDGEVFIIDEKDSELFERAKAQSDDIYYLIENLEFFRVDFVIEGDLELEEKEKENEKRKSNSNLEKQTVNS